MNTTDLRVMIDRLTEYVDYAHDREAACLLPEYGYSETAEHYRKLAVWLSHVRFILEHVISEIDKEQ